MSFSLHPTLAKDTFPVGDLPVCRLLLMNDTRYPWLIAVPRREGLRELFDLSPEDYAQVMAEVRQIAAQFSALQQAHKMNVAALGNMVPQLHIHIIARFENDAAWPSPVWNQTQPPVAYTKEEAAAMTERLRRTFNITKM